MIVHQVVGRIDDLAKLRQDHLLLALEMVLVKMRTAHEVGNQLGDQRQVARERTAVEHGLVPRGPRIER